MSVGTYLVSYLHYRTVYHIDSRNTSASGIDVGLYCLNNDETKPNHVTDFSVLFPIRHVANGLSIIFRPDATHAINEKNDHYIAGLIGICVLSVILIAFCGALVFRNLNNPTSTLGLFLRAFKSSMDNNLMSNSMSNLIGYNEPSVYIPNDNRRRSTEIATTSL